MKTKWCVSTLFFILAVFGVSRYQVTSPNQEIVVQFNDDEAAVDFVQHAVSLVKRQLESAGVDNIHVQASVGGNVKITYYSDFDISRIKEILSSEEKLKIDYTTQGDQKSKDIPLSSSDTYTLNICEIQSSFDAGYDVDGMLAELLPANDRLVIPDLSFSAVRIDGFSQKVFDVIAYSFYSQVALGIDHNTHCIPEVRAGPNLVGMA